MSTSSGSFSNRERAWLLLAATAPVALLAVARVLALMRFVQLALFATAAAVGGAVIFTRPLLGIYFLAFYTFSGIGSLLPLPVAVPLTVTVFGAALLGFLRGEDSRLRDPVFWWSLGFFVLVALQSMLFAHNIGIALLRLVNYAKAFLLVFLVVQFVRTPRELRHLALAIFAGAVATILLGLVAWRLGLVEQIKYVGAQSFVRFAGIHADPNDGAAYMVAALPLGVFAIRHAGSTWMRVLCSLGVVVLIAGVISTFSRGAFIPLGIVLVAVLLREFRRARARVGLLALFAVAIALAPPAYWERVFALTSLADNLRQDWSLLMRWRSVETAWRLFTENPLTGIGMANFVERGATNVWIRMVVHNSYLEILVGTGIFGLLSFSSILWSGLRQSLAGARARWTDGDEWMGALAYYFGVSLVSAMVAALFLSIMYRYLLWFPVAAGLVIGNLLPRRDPARQ